LCREFLTGFHKRKLQRKRKAQEELEQQLKEERKRLKQEVCTTAMMMMMIISELFYIPAYYLITGSAVIYKTCNVTMPNLRIGDTYVRKL
jgi:hypothetical protein